MSLLNRDQVRAKADEVETKDIDVPEWGGSIRIKALGSGARLQWSIAREKAVDGKDAPDPTALLMVLAAIDEQNALVYTVQDCDWLAEADGNVVNRIADAVLALSKMTDDDAADAEGKSDATSSGDSPTDSHATSDGPSPS